MARHLIHKTIDGEIKSTIIPAGIPALEKVITDAADKLEPGETRHVSTASDCGRVMASIGGRVDVAKYIAKHGSRTGSNAHAETGSPGIAGFQNAANASYHAAYNRIQRSREMADWLRDVVGDVQATDNTFDEIVVRARINTRSQDDPQRVEGWHTEWTEKTKSWAKAWAIVDDCCADRADCRKWKSGTTWFLDIDGAIEKRERDAEFKEFIDRVDATLEKGRATDREFADEMKSIDAEIAGVEARTDVAESNAGLMPKRITDDDVVDAMMKHDVEDVDRVNYHTAQNRYNDLCNAAGRADRYNGDGSLANNKLSDERADRIIDKFVDRVKAQSNDVVVRMFGSGTALMFDIAGQSYFLRDVNGRESTSFESRWEAIDAINRGWVTWHPAE